MNRHQKRALSLALKDATALGAELTISGATSPASCDDEMMPAAITANGFPVFAWNNYRNGKRDGRVGLTVYFDAARHATRAAPRRDIDAELTILAHDLAALRARMD